MKNYRILTFSFNKLINDGNIHRFLQYKKFYEQYVLFGLDVFSILLSFYTVIVTEEHTYFN